MPEQLLTVAEVAAHYGVRPVTVRRWIKSGKIPMVVTPGGHYRVPASAVVGSPG